MATPKVCTDGPGGSDLDEAVLNKFLNAGKVEVKANFCRIDFASAGETPTVSGAWDSDGEIVTGDLSYDGTAEEIDIVLSGFTAIPIGLVQLISNASTNVGGVLFRATSSSLVHIRFIGTGAGETGVDPDGDISLALLVVGS